MQSIFHIHRAGLLCLAQCLLVLVSWGQAGQKALLTGPMVGHVSMRSAQLWVQTVGPSEVVAEYMTMATGQDASLG